MDAPGMPWINKNYNLEDLGRRWMEEFLEALLRRSIDEGIILDAPRRRWIDEIVTASRIPLRPVGPARQCLLGRCSRAVLVGWVPLSLSRHSRLLCHTLSAGMTKTAADGEKAAQV